LYAAMGVGTVYDRTNQEIVSQEREEPMEGAFVHESSYVDPGAHIGARSRVWHFSHVMDGAWIGEDCVLGQNVFVARGARVGNRVKIQNNVSVYEGVTLEDDVFCGPSVVFTNVLYPRSPYPKDPKVDYAKTLLREGASVGANATIICGVTVGRWAFVGAGATVSRDVGDFVIAYGCPARPMGWMCPCGEPAHFSRGRALCEKCGLELVMTEGSRVKLKVE